MKKNKTDKALGYAHRLFTIRPRSEKELRERLFKQGFGRATVHSVVDLLKERKILDDLRFAKLWIESRARSNPKGEMFIRRELRGKGVALPLVEKALREAKTDESVLVRDIAAKKARTLANVPKEKARRKLFEYLMRKGFKFDAIEDTVREYFDAE